MKAPQPEIAALAGMTTAELRMAWARLHGSEPPPRLSRDLMIRAIGYRLQEHAHQVVGVLAEERVGIDDVVEVAPVAPFPRECTQTERLSRPGDTVPEHELSPVRRLPAGHQLLEPGPDRGSLVVPADE